MRVGELVREEGKIEWLEGEHESDGKSARRRGGVRVGVDVDVKDDRRYDDEVRVGDASGVSVVSLDSKIESSDFDVGVDGKPSAEVEIAEVLSESETAVSSNCSLG